MERQILKSLGYVILIVLVINMLLFAFRVISWLVFWAVIIVSAVIVYKVLPQFKNKSV